MTIIIIIIKPLWTVASLHCGGYRRPSSYEVTFRQSRSGSIKSFVVDRGVRHHLTLGFQPVERSVCIHRPWCAGTSGLSRATCPNSDALHLDRISCNVVNPVVARIASLVM